MTPREILAALAAPFAPDAVSWRVGSMTNDKSKGMALAYLDARDVMTRLDEVMGADWQCEYVPMPNGTCCCRIGLKIEGEWRWRSNGAVNVTESEKPEAKEMAEKGSYSDAFKRAAVLWGIGAYLYNLDSPWVALEPRGKSFVIAASEMSRLRASLGSRPAQSQQAQQQPKEPTAQERPSKPSSPSTAARDDWEARERAKVSAAVAANLLDGNAALVGLRTLYKALGSHTPLSRTLEDYETWDKQKKRVWRQLTVADQQMVTKAVNKFEDALKSAKAKAPAEEAA